MRIAIISDIHEDFESLKKAEKIIIGERCDHVMCLGDIVGFSAPYYAYYQTRDANACIRWVRNHCEWVVAGNHDLYAIRKLPVSLVRGFVYPARWYDLPFSERVRLSDNQLWLYEDNELSALLDIDTAEYLNQLPEMVIIDVDGTRCLLSHYIYPDITGSARAFLAGFDDLREHIQYMQQNLCTLGFSGHIHPGGYFRMPQPSPEVIRFSKTSALLPFDWVGVPPITCSKNNNGFLIWDTAQHTIKTVPLRKKFLLG